MQSAFGKSPHFGTRDRFDQKIMPLFLPLPCFEEKAKFVKSGPVQEILNR
jgi:hypothetical protein